MKSEPNSSAGSRYLAIGIVIFIINFFTSLLHAAYFVERMFPEFSSETNMNAASVLSFILLVAVQFLPVSFVSNVFIQYGSAIRDSERNDRNFVLSKKVRRLFFYLQMLLLCVLECFVGMLYSRRTVTAILFGVAAFCLAIFPGVYALVHGKDFAQYYEEVPHQTDAYVRSSSAAQASNTSVCCEICGKQIPLTEAKKLDGKCCCSSCRKKLADEKEAKRQRKRAKEQHTPCRLCGRDFPRSDLHLIGSLYACEDCFRQMYETVDEKYWVESLQQSGEKPAEQEKS